MNNNISYLPVDFDPFDDGPNRFVPTTEAQREIWTNVKFGGRTANCAYNESVSLHLAGKFDYNALCRAAEMLFLRHDSLRSTISDDGMSLVIAASCKVEVPLLNFSDTPEKDIPVKLKAILDAEAEHEFNLSTGPLGHVKVIKFSDVKFQLILTFHHIVCDGWSLGIMMQDLSKMYSAIVSKKEYSDDPAVSYAEYSQNEFEYNNSDELKLVESFWINQFKDNIPAMEMPLNKPRPAFRTYNAKRIDHEVDTGIVKALKQMGAKQGASFIATMTAAFEIFLYRISGSEDIVVGLAAAGQSATGMTNLVGHCVNLLPLRSKINPQINFSEYLKSRKSQILDAYDNQRYTFGSLIQKLKLPRDPSRIPLVPVSFNVDMGITNGVHFEGCTYSFTTNPRHYENFEIFINAAGNGDELTFECTFNTDLFTEEMMQLRMNEFIELLNSIVRDQTKPLGLLNILTDWEREKLFLSWQGKWVDYKASRCIHQLLEESAAQNPGAIALVYENSSITYRELNERSNQLAHYLISKGVGKDILVAVFLERSIEMMISILGILKSGGAYVPVDLSYPEERIKHVIEDSKTKLVITHKHAKELFQEVCEEFLFIEELNEVTKALPVVLPSINYHSNNLAYVIYTSGSTGKPKGVVVEHFSVVNYISWSNNYYFGDREMGNFGLYSSLSFDLTVTSIFCTLTRGKTLTIFNQKAEIPDILKSSFSTSNTIDVIKMTPAHILLLEGTGLRTSKIKKAIVGGEELSPRHVEILRSINPEMEIVNEYGPTEATVGCVIKDVIHPGDALTIGKPIDNTEIYILDNNLQPLPPGIAGRMYIAGGGLAREYFGKEELTNEKFQILTVNDEAVRMYDSGDLARYRFNGELDFLGRIDNQVKIRGYRIELGEIESVLASLQGVKEQLVVAKDDGNGVKSLLAYLVLEDGFKSDSSIYYNHLKKFLPEYMVPSTFLFLESFPLTPNGKVDKKALPLPEKGGSVNDKLFEEPKTAIEQVIANIWCSVLSLEKVGRKDNFFELGGHSILGVKMFNEVEAQLGVKINLSMLFAASTIEELARLVNNEGPSKPLSCLVPLQQNGSKNPLFCIHMHNGNVNRWRVMVKHLGSDQPVYAIQPLGLDINKEPHRTIEQMAAHYINIVQEVQPHGPYNLLGLCFSGMVVFEMAALLQAKGEKVSFLGMVNNYAPPENPTMYRIKTGLNKFMKMEIGEKFNYAVEKNVNLGKKLLYKSKILNPVPDHAVEEIQIDEPVVETGHDLRTIHSLALLNYHPTHIFNGNLFIFRTADPIESFYNQYLGWDRLVKGMIDTTIIEGCDNDTIITEEPYNILLSQKVKEHLDSLS